MLLLFSKKVNNKLAKIGGLYKDHIDRAAFHYEKPFG
jgi:hypothetical protein